ncbi:MAG: hypothetical protein HZB42_00530 [Sphingobacteriales bacterium]|nr:hypothetical protein [Sphingobacteriales bacterium]
MFCRRGLLIFTILFSGLGAFNQKIVYSEPDKDDTRRMNFEIAGKISGNFLIYKNTRVNKHIISVLDNEMKETASAELDFLPSNERMINIDFFPYSDFCYAIYQYQKKNVVYCAAARIDGMGKKTGEVVELDTTHIGFAANNRIYTVITSEDKGKIMLFKINSRNRQLYFLTTLLLNDKLESLKKSRLSIKMEDRNEYLSDFVLDNEGDMAFSKFYRNSNDNISNASLLIKSAVADSLHSQTLNIEKNWLDEIHIKPDNSKRRFLLTSFYVKERRGNIEGYYFYVWDKATFTPVLEVTSAFSEELRREARGDAGVKTAFNDHFIRNIIIRRDGGFVIGSECYYTTSRFNNWNRWDYLYGSSYMNSYDYYYSPYYNNYWWRSGRSSNQAVRYHADNISVLSFDDKGRQEWNNVMGKSQYDDESDDLLSYQMLNSGGQLHFLFNMQERRNNLLTDFSIAPDGKLTRNPTLKNLDKGYDFMPKYGKQVSARQMIVPCQYRNYICFAKIEYN